MMRRTMCRGLRRMAGGAILSGGKVWERGHEYYNANHVDRCRGAGNAGCRR